MAVVVTTEQWAVWERVRVGTYSSIVYLVIDWLINPDKRVSWVKACFFLISSFLLYCWMEFFFFFNWTCCFKFQTLRVLHPFKIYVYFSIMIFLNFIYLFFFKEKTKVKWLFILHYVSLNCLFFFIHNHYCLLSSLIFEIHKERINN